MSTPAETLEEQYRLISAAYDPEMVRKVGTRMAALLADHLRRVEDGAGRVLNWEEPSQNIELARAQIRQGNVSPAVGNAELATRFEQLLQQSLSHGQNLHHPRYVGHQVPASVPLAALFDAATTLTNQVMAIYEMGPWATAIERAVVEQLGEAMGFTPGQFGGLITSGGSLANLTALLTARNAALSECWSNGLAGLE
ncbi:MAG: hypothetical protein KDA57_11615, partial [Planctomycetales bacterium]|nr:hypothetical protein [Planctomycetales bacterium]